MSPETLRGLLGQELDQRAEEGCDVAALRSTWDRLKAQPAGEVEAEQSALWTLLESLPAPTDATEPSTLEGIQALRQTGPRVMAVDDATLRERMLGALLGRIAGCQLGKPVEGWPKADIDAYLAACGETELRDYFPYLDPAPEGLARTITMRGCCRGELHGALRDDDQDYTILGLHLAARHGLALTPKDVALGWLEMLPGHKTYTAERVAYRNLLNDLWPPDSATYRNPYREWIGAQIRCDGWAYVAAGHPELAADLAWRDAAVSHVKNGLYGEMFFAAAIAAAFAASDLDEALDVGLSEIPADCRLAECVRQVRTWASAEPDWRRCFAQIEAHYGHYHWVHTINNAALVLLGLLYGRDDYAATVGIAVHGGWDTDCNGATAGSLFGALHGTAALPAHFIDPLEGRVQSALFGFAENRIEDLAGLALRTREKLLG